MSGSDAVGHVRELGLDASEGRVLHLRQLDRRVRAAKLVEPRPALFPAHRLLRPITSVRPATCHRRGEITLPCPGHAALGLIAASLSFAGSIATL